MEEFKPWIHEKVISILEEKITKNTKILEFGSGYSTIFFDIRSDYVISIEHNKLWYEKILNLLQFNKNTYILKEINYISKQPINNKLYNSDTLEELIGYNIDYESLDIIIVDGIDRVNCVNDSYLKLKKGGLLILDDSNRIDNPDTDGSYKPIENLLINYEHLKFRSTNRNTDIWIKQ